MTIEDFTNKADGLINDFSGGASDEKEFRDGILDLLLEVATPAIQVEAKVKPANGEQEVDCWHCKEFEQHTNQRLGHCHKHKFDAKARIAKIIKCENFIHY